MALAARLTDPHACSIHGGGPITGPGAPTVLIGGLPAARVTDLATCPGAPDTIVLGSPTVLIGGLPAARMGDQTAHGGTILIGCVTVDIGDGASSAAVFPFRLTGSDDVRAQLQSALGLLYSTKTGREIIRRIAASGHTVEIQTTQNGSQCAASSPTESGPGGKGSDSVVSWNPTELLDDLPANDPRSGAVILGHELVHAEHSATATDAGGPHENHHQVGTSARGEERQTVGSAPLYDASGKPTVDPDGNPNGTHVIKADGSLEQDADYSQRQTSENAIRDDLGMQRRATYYPADWPGGPPW